MKILLRRTRVRSERYSAIGCKARAAGKKITIKASSPKIITIL